MYSGEIGSILAKMVELGKSGCIRVKFALFG